MSWGAHAGIGDRFHHYMDRRMRAGGGTGNGSQFLFELEGRLDPEALRERLDALQGPWTEVPLEVLEGSPEVEAFFNEHYARDFPRPESAQPLQAILSLGQERSLLLLRWSHVLMDAPGGDLLVRMLDGEDPDRFRLHDSPPSLWKRASRGAWLRALLAVHAHALRFLLGSVPAPAQRRPQPLPFAVLVGRPSAPLASVASPVRRRARRPRRCAAATLQLGLRLRPRHAPSLR